MKSKLIALAAVSLGMAATMAACSKPAEAKVWSSHKVANLVQSKHFKVADIRRKGATYVVVANGPKGNKVQIVVDGKSGKVLGLDVIKWAPGAKRVKRGSHGVDLFDEFYEFGVMVPVAVYATWTDYTVTQWSSSEEYIELSYEETTEVVTTEEVTYEESIEEVTETTAEEQTVETSEESSESSATSESSSSEESTSEDSAESNDDHSDADDSSGSGGDDPH